MQNHNLDHIEQLLDVIVKVIELVTLIVELRKKRRSSRCTLFVYDDKMDQQNMIQNMIET